MTVEYPHNLVNFGIVEFIVAPRHDPFVPEAMELLALHPPDSVLLLHVVLCNERIKEYGNILDTHSRGFLMLMSRFTCHERML